jgi:predicted ATP-grasp superfamily ATP-dependent carboligase
MRGSTRLKAADLPPGPFDIQVNNSGFAYVVDANGRKIATLLGTSATKAAVGSLLCLARERLKPKPADADQA